jgi:hypothetical protein
MVDDHFFDYPKTHVKSFATQKSLCNHIKKEDVQIQGNQITQIYSHYHFRKIIISGKIKLVLEFIIVYDTKPKKPVQIKFPIDFIAPLGL